MNKKYHSLLIFCFTFVAWAMLLVEPAHATEGMNPIVTSISDSVRNVPLLLAMVAYLSGISFIVFGLFKLKQHVESPGNMPLKNAVGIILIGGALLASPVVVRAAQSAIQGNNEAPDTRSIYTNIKSRL